MTWVKALLAPQMHLSAANGSIAEPNDCAVCLKLERKAAVRFNKFTFGEHGVSDNRQERPVCVESPH